MSGPRTQVAAPVAPQFTELWRCVSKLGSNNAGEKETGQQMPGTSASAMCKDSQSPKQRRCSRYGDLNNGDSPGDVEPTQDIIWDPTSPTSGLRNTRVVQISDIVNRIAPKDGKQKGADSPLLQWIDDSAVPSTPDFPKPRVRKRPSRQNSVDDLLKLARQFDENMQQDRESSEQLKVVNCNPNECANTCVTRPSEVSFLCDVKDLKSPSPLEAELHALFDCSTQRVSGRLSQGSSASTRSQEVKPQPLTSTSAEPRQPEVKSADRSDLATHPAEEKAACAFSANTCDDFDDDWDDDDLLNDSFVLAMTQNADQQPKAGPKTTLQPNTETNTTRFPAACKPTADGKSAHQPSTVQSKPSCSALLELCPKPKTTNRCTFKLEPNPHFQPIEVSKPSVSVIPPKSKMSEQKSAATKTPSIPIPASTTTQKETRVAADISDSLWDDGADDALFYQVCDSIERISNSQPQQASPSQRQEKQVVAADGQRETPAPLPVSNRQSACALVCSNSLPGTSSGTGDYQGWNIPMKGANNKSGMSQSLPGSRVSLGTFNQLRDSSGTFQNNNVDMKPHAVTARTAQDSKSHHTAFKRNVSDSAVISNKVFVTSQMTGKCSAAEIERKKQEALAKRRLRTQNAPKP